MDFNAESKARESKWVGCKTEHCSHWVCPRCLDSDFDYNDNYFCPECEWKLYTNEVDGKYLSYSKNLIFLCIVLVAHLLLLFF